MNAIYKVSKQDFNGLYTIVVGYFTTEQEAQAVAAKVSASFTKPDQNKCEVKKIKLGLKKMFRYIEN